MCPTLLIGWKPATVCVFVVYCIAIVTTFAAIDHTWRPLSRLSYFTVPQISAKIGIVVRGVHTPWKITPPPLPLPPLPPPPPALRSLSCPSKTSEPTSTKQEGPDEKAQEINTNADVRARLFKGRPIALPLL